jgi:putative transposase
LIPILPLTIFNIYDKIFKYPNEKGGEKTIIYKTLIVPLKCNKSDFQYLSKLNSYSAQVWNFCVQIDKKHIEENGKAMGLSALEHATKGIVPIHASGINHIVFKYIYARSAMWNSRKANHKDSRKVNLPYKEKKHIATGWNYQNIKIDRKKRTITLCKPKPKGKRNQKPVICIVKTIPDNIVEIELVYKDKYYLAIKYKEPDNTNLIQSENSASIDLGEIHAITSIDNNGNAIIITNRKVRSIVRLKDKRQGKLQTLRSKHKKESRQYKKYTKAIYKIKHKTERRILDAVHKQTKLFWAWCIENKIKTVYYGNVDSTTRNTKGKLSKFTNHKLNMWYFGRIINQLENKLSRYGIQLICVNEAYTTKTCPNCKKINKPKGRNYICDCGYTQHRDIVGSINILNQNAKTTITRFVKKEYLQIN